MGSVCENRTHTFLLLAAVTAITVAKFNARRIAKSVTPKPKIIMGWGIVKGTALFVLGFVLALFCVKYDVKNKHVLNDVEYANYCTLEYKIGYINAADSLINELTSIEDVHNYIADSVPESYIKYCYYAYFLPSYEGDTVDVDYETYKEDFCL